MLYRSGKLPLVILAKVNNNFWGRLAILKANVLSLVREKPDSYKLKLELLNWHISKLVMTTRN